MSRDLYTASCVLCCGVCWLLCTACGSFHKYLWPLWCYSQGLYSVRRLHHNTCIPRPAVRGLGGLGGGKKPWALLYIFYGHFTFIWFWCFVWRKWRRGREGGISTHHRGIKRVNHNLFFLFFFFFTKGRGCWDCDCQSIRLWVHWSKTLVQPEYLDNFWTDVHEMWYGRGISQYQKFSRWYQYQWKSKILNT